MPMTGTPSLRMPGSRSGEPGSYTLDGPPLKTIAAGFFSATSSALSSLATMVLKNSLISFSSVMLAYDVIVRWM